MKWIVKGKKGQQANVIALVSGAVGIGVLAITLGILSTVLTRLRTTQGFGQINCNTTNTTGCGFDVNASTQGLTGIDQFSQFQTTIAIIVVSVFIIGLVLVGFAVSRRR